MGDNPKEASEVINEGFTLIDQTAIPHFDNPDFKKFAVLTNNSLLKDGFKTIP